MVKKMTFKQFLFILPLLIFIGVFSIYPIVTSFMYTFFDYRINDQTANSFYLSERFNGELFYEDCDYINYFLDDDKTLMSEEDQKAVEEIQATVSSVMSEYENAKGTEKISSDKKDELVAFKEKLRTDITALYDKYPDVEFYNKDKIPEILDEMDTCIVKSNFIGLKAYGNLIKDTRFWKALGHTLIFTVISVGIELVLGMLLALIMNKAMKGIGLVRTVALIPWAIPTAVSAMIWSYLYDGSYGIVSFLFNKLGIINSQSAMLLTSHGAMSAAIIADVWKTTPYMALLLLAGLQVIDRGLYESSAIDGAGPVVTFFKITLPLVKPSLLVALLFRTLDAFRVYDLIAILTGGGPGNGTESLSIYAYKLMFDQSNYGYSSVVVMGMFVVVAIIAFLYVKVLGADVMGND
ncbi:MULTISPECIES: carbohydrate ABC transporter permease [Blautia]|jgi:multiple sugar transport system permease protein|uniref:carbohydrate ABC transporter permease n=1 Tax=Blautia TaxID=572511 RepID=UPI000E49B24E|nr:MULTISPECIES: sugar ABC transporter permease [Blautia]RHO12989.1 sugar ABC transporter permease [Ruminococcus sp. AM18-44]RHO22780.1 sugar ABC transporter permease [Ruminococcus sp. AM18-15]RHP43885.1 sugar ABC transporter permease [Ruminococcus sp. AF33-11BH]RHQ38707.1 sugar ABC transporter permease [Ruminococcus sp. AF25-28AC]RHT00983.1 sugar ABC transporter permease [Ruminococcus sp. AM42-10AC]RHT12229.1 sugar ABC transporter permease [Ruminococcus sp. AM36-17]RJW30827.1 sugar ABC tran